VTDRTTSDGKPPEPGMEAASAPAAINPETGQHRAYWVLTPEERAKGFVRPVRHAYLHRGRRVCGRPRDAMPDFACVLEPGHADACYQWTQVKPEQVARLHKLGLLGGCDARTSMSNAIAETYARDPKFYGSTFCAQCREHRPVQEFVWLDEDQNETTEIVGS